MSLLSRLLRVTLGLLIVALVVSVAMGVFYRYVLRDSLYWATEVPNFIMIWLVFLGSVTAFHEKKHIAFTLVQEAMPQRAGAVLELISAVVVLVFLAVVAVYGVRVVSATMNSESEALKIPMGYIYACLPISAVLMAVSALESLGPVLTRLKGGASS